VITKVVFIWFILLSLIDAPNILILDFTLFMKNNLHVKSKCP
jgi:hypothetical protein